MNTNNNCILPLYIRLCKEIILDEQYIYSKHLEECNNKCEVKDMFSIVPFYKIKDTESETLVKEQYFTTRFNTTLNNLTLN